jgi:hypothetical protein
MLVFAVVVAGYGSGADVGTFADIGVAYVGEMRDLGVRAYGALLYLDEAPDLSPVLDFSAASQVSEGTNLCVSAYIGVAYDRRPENDVAALDPYVAQYGISPDANA